MIRALNMRRIVFFGMVIGVMLLLSQVFYPTSTLAPIVV